MLRSTDKRCEIGDIHSAVSLYCPLITYHGTDVHTCVQYHLLLLLPVMSHTCHLNLKWNAIFLYNYHVALSRAAAGLKSSSAPFESLCTGLYLSQMDWAIFQSANTKEFVQFYNMLHIAKLNTSCSCALQWRVNRRTPPGNTAVSKHSCHNAK